VTTATEEILDWVRNDHPVCDHLARAAEKSNGPERVQWYITELLYGSSGPVLYRRRHQVFVGSLAGFEEHLPGLVRDRLEEIGASLSEVDWETVAREARTVINGEGS
jgi:hypothetical protein